MKIERRCSLAAAPPDSLTLLTLSCAELREQYCKARAGGDALSAHAGAWPLIQIWPGAPPNDENDKGHTRI